MEQNKLKIGMIGFGARGTLLLRDIVLPMGKVEVKAVCDSYLDRAERAADQAEDIQGSRPMICKNYKEVINKPEVEAIIITCAWEDHIRIAIEAMRAGKAVGMEVGGAYTIEQCWDLVRTYEETKTPIMLLENCCYGRREMMARHMAELGVFGKIVHCKGGYHHDLREEVSRGEENRHYRLRNYLNRNCENYPTHELGPIAKILHINRGNRMMSLVSMASKSEGLHEYIYDRFGKEHELAEANFAQGDIITTVIRCAGGETITLTLDTTLPRYYCRDFTVRGTKGMYEEVTDSVFLDKVHHEYDLNWKEQWGNAEKYSEEFEHPIWKSYREEGVRGSHDGMDWLVFRDFFDSIINGTECPIDVYDTAAWMCITALSEESILMGGKPVLIPDFTKGAWMTRGDQRGI